MQYCVSIFIFIFYFYFILVDMGWSSDGDES